MSKGINFVYPILVGKGEESGNVFAARRYQDSPIRLDRLFFMPFIPFLGRPTA